ncbi:MAG: hypothetical protein H7Y03_04280 [Chitinophagaceae bacterium]|nr:hypothetical protein [Chitinophagaceae bacterium]
MNPYSFTTFNDTLYILRRQQVLPVRFPIIHRKAEGMNGKNGRMDKRLGNSIEANLKWSII